MDQVCGRVPDEAKKSTSENERLAITVTKTFDCAQFQSGEMYARLRDVFRLPGL